MTAKKMLCTWCVIVAAVVAVHAGAIGNVVVPNPSFEVDDRANFTSVGYIQAGVGITGWNANVASHGLNTETGPFYQPVTAGEIPDGSQIAFVQLNNRTAFFENRLETPTTGFEIGATYQMHFYQNVRASTWQEGQLLLGAAVRFTGEPLVTILPLEEIAPTPQFVEITTEPFVATAETARLRFNFESFSDQTVLLDMVRVTRVDMPTLPGDANRDGRVDGEDFLIWQAAFGTQSGAAWEDGDFNGDGRVDGEDFLIWQAHFGSVAGSSALTPEPAALGLLLIGGVVLLRRRR